MTMSSPELLFRPSQVGGYLQSAPRILPLVGEVDLGLEVRGGDDAAFNALTARLARDRGLLHARLLDHGALRLRGVNMHDPARQFAQLATAFSGSAPFDYVGGDSPRTRVGGQVYTSTEMPPDVPIALHNELSFAANYPRYLFFYCVAPATTGGESTLADSRAVLAALPAALREKFVRHGVRYRYAYPGPSKLVELANRVVNVNKTWMDVYETRDPREAEARCRAVGMEPRWQGDRLVAHATRPGAIPHPDTGELMWFNQVHLFNLSARAIGWWRYAQARVAFLHPDFDTRSATFGDGSPVTREDLGRVLDALDANTVAMNLEAGDVLILDNVRCMHGRRPFRGPRRLLVAMTK